MAKWLVDYSQPCCKGVAHLELRLLALRLLPLVPQLLDGLALLHLHLTQLLARRLAQLLQAQRRKNDVFKRAQAGLLTLCQLMHGEAVALAQCRMPHGVGSDRIGVHGG